MFIQYIMFTLDIGVYYMCFLYKYEYIRIYIYIIMCLFIITFVVYRHVQYLFVICKLKGARSQSDISRFQKSA